MKAKFTPLLYLPLTVLLTIVILYAIGSSSAQTPKQSGAPGSSNGLIDGFCTDSNNVIGDFFRDGTNSISTTNSLLGGFTEKIGDSKGSLSGSYFDSNHPGYGLLFNSSNSTTTDDRNGSTITWTQEH